MDIVQQLRWNMLEPKGAILVELPSLRKGITSSGALFLSLPQKSKVGLPVPCLPVGLQNKSCVSSSDWLTVQMSSFL